MAKPKTIKTVPELIEACGGSKIIADLIHIEPGIVRQWKNRGAIPEVHCRKVLRAIRKCIFKDARLKAINGDAVALMNYRARTGAA